jgi:hypothetical protein
MFLTEDQLQELTGYRQPKAQVTWLQKNGVRHYVRADGRPKVPTAAIESPDGVVPSVVLPDFDAVRPRN